MTEISIRLANILTRLFNEEVLNKHDLAKEFGVATKTIQRDINERLHMLPVEKNRKGDYFLDSKYIKKNNETLKKLIRVFDIKTIPARLSDDLLNELLDENKSLVKMNNSIETKNISENYEIAMMAILKNKELKGIYNGKSRIIKPYKLVNHQDIWYLLALDEKIKSFALYKFKNLRLGNSFIVDESIKQKIDSSENSFISLDSKEVILELDSIAKGYFLERKILSNQTIIDNKLNKLIIKTKVDFDDEIIRLVFKWIPHIKILEPTYLANELKSRLNNYINKI